MIVWWEFRNISIFKWAPLVAVKDFYNERFQWLTFFPFSLQWKFPLLWKIIFLVLSALTEEIFLSLGYHFQRVSQHHLRKRQFPTFVCWYGKNFPLIMQISKDILWFRLASYRGDLEFLCFFRSRSLFCPKHENSFYS